MRAGPTFSTHVPLPQEAQPAAAQDAENDPLFDSDEWRMLCFKASGARAARLPWHYLPAAAEPEAFACRRRAWRL